MKKKIFLIIITLFVFIITSFYLIVSRGYDRQNKVILFIKEIIPPHFARQVREKIFFIPNLKERNKFLSLQVEKYEQGFEGNLFKEQKIKSSKDKEYLVKEFFLPFPRLDMRLGWAATENSRRAHYLEVVDDKIIAISGVGQTIYFNKENIKKKKLQQKEIKNNINEYLESKKYELIGIRDLFVEDNFVYISLQHKDTKGFTINIYRAELNFEKLNFKPFFIINEYWKNYNVFSGGRIEKFKENKILFSIGYSAVKRAAQNKGSLLGKIIAIDKTTSEYNLVSMGHRNPQGLFYIEDMDVIVNTEHGPKGGDEININFQNLPEVPNYGWDIVSYGVPYGGKNDVLYGGKDVFKKSHAKYGFIEPFINYTPAIGISEIIYLDKKNKSKYKNNFYVSSLRAGSIYIISTDDKISKIVDEDRLFFKEQRIRDIKFDKDMGVFFIIFEFTPSIGVMYLKD